MTIDTSVIKIVVLVLLGFSLWFGQKVCGAIMSNIEQLGGDEKAKERVATRALTNFWIGFAAVIIIVSGIFDLIGRELFIAFLTADLLGLGVKLTTEFIETKKSD